MLSFRSLSSVHSHFAVNELLLRIELEFPRKILPFAFIKPNAPQTARRVDSNIGNVRVQAFRNRKAGALKVELALMGLALEGW
jgi:hypothetical protein